MLTKINKATKVTKMMAMAGGQNLRKTKNTNLQSRSRLPSIIPRTNQNHITGHHWTLCCGMAVAQDTRSTKEYFSLLVMV
ncbi:unnamed protein product [Absidia cylindrospora]